MAKLILTIEPQFQNVETSIETLKTKIEGLIPSFSMKGAKVDSELIKGLEQLKATLKTIKIDPTVTNGIKALTEHYKQLGIVVRDIAKEYTKLDTQQRKQEQIIHSQASNVETVRKGYANLIATLKTLKGQYSGEAFGSLPDEAQKSFKEIEQLSQAFEKNKSLSEEETKSLARLSQQLKKLQADLATLKAKNERIVSPNPFTVSQAQQIPKLTKQYSALLNSIKNVEKYYPKGAFETFKGDLSAGLTQLNALNTEFKTTGALSESSQTQLNNLANGFNQLNASVAQTQSTLKSSKGSLKDIITGFLKFQLSAMLVMKPLQMIRSALTSINETLVKTEDTVIALQRVLPSGSASDNDISSRLYKIAQDYGQTFENVSQIATNFARAGMSWNDAIKATESAVLALNVAELDATEASDGMIAILTQFGLEAKDLTLVVDKLNITADNAAVTTEKLLAALQRTGSAASNANLSLDETLSIITALSEATGRSGQNLGTAVNSLIQYSSKSSALETFANLSEESAEVVAQYRQGGATILDVWKQVSKEIQHLKADQADLLDNYFNTDDGNALKEALDGELEDIYTELGGVYDTANTFRKNYFIALLGNMDTVEKAMGTLQGAAGYSQDENQKYLSTYTAKLNTLKAQWQDIANSAQGLLGIKKLLVDIGSGLLTVVKWTGGLRTTLIAISAIVLPLIGPKIIAGIQTIFATLSGGLTTLKSAAGWIGLIATAISVVVGIAQQAQEESQKDYTEGLSNAKSALDDLSTSLEATSQQYEKYKKAIVEARAVLENETSTTSEIASAKDTLLTIQDALTKSNSDYADSINVVNGSLHAQLGLLDKLNEDQARKQVQEYIRNNKDAIENAKKYQSETFSEITTGESGSLYGGLTDENFLLTNFLGGTQGSEEDGWGAFNEGFKSIFGGKISGYAQLGENKTREQIIAWLEEQYNKAQWYENKDELQSRIRSLINTFQNEDYNTSYEILHGDSDSSDWILRLTQEQRELFAEGKLTYQQIKEILGLEKEIDSTNKEWHNNISKVTGKYEDLISKFEELRDLQKESTEWEEKKLAVLEAEQALENAKNEATVRRFNQATGQWEWQTDEKKIAEAEKNLQQAQINLQEAAYTNIIDQLKEQTATNDSILEVIKEVAPLLGEDFSNAVQNAIKDKTGVDITQPVITPSESHDNGGLALGKGFINKATNRPESVNNPELTRKILSPVSNAEFNRYVRDMGIMFERSHQYAQAPIIERVGGATDNRVDNSGQITLNGVTIGSDKRGSSLNELLSLANIVPNI